MSQPDDSLTVALVRETFTGPGADARLRQRLGQARDRGAALAVLPELPLDAWHPAHAEARPADAEAPGGRRHQQLAAAAAHAGLGLVGGAIVQDPTTGQRHNTAVVFDPDGTLSASYRKVHVPWEEGFWERAHFSAGDAPPVPFTGCGWRLGLQLCSDLQRPQGCLLLGAAGAEAVLSPRATLEDTWARWRMVIRASAVTAAVYVLSVTRPGPEAGVPMGGPSVAVDPHGVVVLETTEPLGMVTLEHAVVAAARQAYPGYLDVRADLYAQGWAALARRGDRG